MRRERCGNAAADKHGAQRVHERTMVHGGEFCVTHVKNRVRHNRRMPMIEQTLRTNAQALAECALQAVQREFPHKLDHLILHAQDQPLPCEIHPVFWGSYDWHSSVHMHWSLLRLRRLAPTLAARGEIESHLDAHFTGDKVLVERRYASEPGRGGFERPYGWAWLLKLQCELLLQAGDARTTAWREALWPFAQDIASRMAAYLAKSHYPVRAGTHANSAFTMLLARDYAVQASDLCLLDAIDARAKAWFGGDTAYPAAYEPSGSDFLSAGLCEALLMQRVLGDAFGPWWSGFDAAGQAMRHWAAPAVVSDRLDAQMVHLDGLNLSRAWCLRALAAAIGSPPMHAAAQAHWDAAWPHVTTGDFVATHWLVSFALLSLEAS